MKLVDVIRAYVSGKVGAIVIVILSFSAVVATTLLVCTTIDIYKRDIRKDVYKVIDDE